jgi:UDP-N-acetylmuramoyl-L-alanyl-D-glutamate--2,6-diaminopimelate ligase
MAEENDIVLIAGKGHEEYQEIGEKRFPFNDREVVEESIRHLINNT